MRGSGGLPDREIIADTRWEGRGKQTFFRSERGLERVFVWCCRGTSSSEISRVEVNDRIWAKSGVRDS